jgi:plasmid maintenance system antidote protein VapI
MQRQGITNAVRADRMHVNKAQVDRILKAQGKITIETSRRAAAPAGPEPRADRV